MSFDALGLHGRRVLFVASTGGHLSEIGRIAPELEFGAGSSLVTFEAPQSRAVAWIDDLRYVPYVSPRDAAGTAKASKYFLRLMRSGGWDAVVSTGAAIAVAALPISTAFRVRSIYIESYARFLAPSTTGRILSRLPGDIELYTQHRAWTSDRWRYTGSVLDTVRSRERATPLRAPRWFVTLGTISPYRFDALVDAVLALLPPGTDVVWQLGCTHRHGLPGRVYSYLDADAFAAEAHRADVVFSHAGVGTAIELIEMGHKPFLVPRRGHRHEHVDDHQIQIARDLAQRGLARTCDARGLREAVLAASAA